jgi:hypothetical protein
VRDPLPVSGRAEAPLPWLDEVVRARRSIHLPVVLTSAEVQEVLEALCGFSRLVAQLRR